MCGIAGYYGTAALPPARLQACLARMGRRGPDGGATLHRRIGGRNAYLLHTRLRIIDLDPRANQPFAEGSGHLSYNGELYNYLELRKALEQQGGEAFRTEGDTEILAKVLAGRGWHGLDACEGMWAFAWVDEGGLLLSRDRFGEKPLYVFEDEGGVYFASEPKFLFALMGRQPAPNVPHLYRYLVNGYKALYKTPATFFEGVRQVDPGTVERYDAAGRRAAHRYWTPAFDRDDERMTFAQAAEAVRARLVESVKLRLRADVPIAFCLSGGVDSNALISIAKRILKYDVHGFTIMNTDERYEEREMVETAVRELGLRHTAIPVETAGFLDNLRELVRYHDSPVSTITYYAQWKLMEAVAAHGYKVSVSGTGADELFSGYFDHHNFYLQALAGEPQREAREHWRRVVAPIVRNPYLQDPDVFVKRPALRDHVYLDADDFSAFLFSGWKEGFAEERYSRVALRNRMANELFHESVPPILHEDDLNAMYFSIENRSPFLDRGLFELAQTIPTRHLVREGRAKAVLREAVRGIAPDAVVDNPRKVGFNVPIFGYLDARDPGVRARILADSPIYEHVRRERIAGMLDEASLPNSQSKFLFYFLNAKIFLEEFGTARAAERAA